jgi:single stranded DNA-binding protein
MATDIARAFFVGRLTRDLETMVAGNGNSFGIISIAVNKYQGKDIPEKTSFFRVTVGSKTVEGIGQYLTKGRQVAIDSVPVMNSWIDVNGNKRSTIEFIATDIQLLSTPKGTTPQDTTATATAGRTVHESYKTSGHQATAATGIKAEDDDFSPGTDEADESFYGELPF